MAGLLGIIDTIHPEKARPSLARMAEKCVHVGPSTALTNDGPASLRWSGRTTPAKALSSEQLVVMVTGSVRLKASAPLNAPANLSDTELLHRAWKRWGLDACKYLDGSFAAAIYERQTQVLHLIRDRVGIRPLYWCHRPGRLAFSSDLTSLLELPWVSRELKREHLAEYLSFRAVHAPRTLLRDVYQIPAGNRLRFAPNGVLVTPYHTPKYAAPDTPVPREQDVVPELRASIHDAVHHLLHRGRRVGAYLSGGAGSAAILAAARESGRSIPTYTVSFAEDPSPESPFAGRVAQLMGMDHHTVTVGTKDIAHQFDQVVGTLSQPIGNASVILQHHLAQAAASDVDVIVTGDGADQLFGSRTLRRTAQLLRRSEAYHQLPYLLRGPVQRVLRKGNLESKIPRPPEQIPLANQLGGTNLFSERERRRLVLDEDFVHPNIRREVLQGFYAQVDTDPLNAVLHASWRSTLEADTLPRVESTAASAGISVSFPLLTRQVRSLAWMLPGAFKARGLTESLPGRWLLRAALKGTLPPALINRPNRGLPRPLESWLGGPGRLFTEERFAELRSDPLELWHHTGLEALRRSLERSQGAAHRLWALFILDSWIKQHRLN